jgi:iron complex outermembrane receptor protein
LAEVIVTAERRSEDVQKSAASISVRSGDELSDQGKYSLESILEDVPGMSGGAAATPIGTGGSGTDNQAAGLVIRGIPSNIGVGGGITSVASAAAVYVDGVYEGVGGGYDIDRVEALRGPQGTLYGRSATSGLVAIHTRDPQLNKFGGNASVEAGNYGLRHYSGAVNIPLGETFALRVSGNKYERDGYYSEVGGSANNTDGRIKLLFEPSDTFSLLVGAAGQNNKTNSGGVTSILRSPNNQFSVTENLASLSPGDNKYRQFWARMNWNLGFATLMYLPAYRTWDSTAIARLRPTPAQLAAGQGGFDQYSITDKDTFWTHELNLASNPDSTLRWQVGTFYYDNSLHNLNIFYRVPSNAFYRSQDVARDTTALSAFAEATYPVTEATRVTAGFRYDSTKVQVNEVFRNNTNCDARIPGTQGGPNSVNYCLPEIVFQGDLSGDAGKRTFKKSTYKLRLEHDLTPMNLVYAMVSTGVSPGDITLTVDLRPTINGNPNPNYQKPVPKELKSEVLTSYEIGTKNRFLEDRLQINATAFYYDYGAYTVANANVNGARNAQGVFITIPTPTQFEALSAPLTTYGLELETLYQLTPDDRFGFNYTYTQAKFHDKNSPVPGSDATFGDFFGLDTVPGLIPHRASLTYDHNFKFSGGSTLALRIAERWNSAHKENGTSAPISKNQVATVYAAISPWIDAKAELYTDANLTWTSPEGTFWLTGWVRNAFDDQYKRNVNLSQVNQTNVANGTAFSSISTGLTDPRTIGVSVSMKW